MPLFPRFSKKNDEILQLKLAGGEPPGPISSGTIVFGKPDAPLATMEAQRSLGKPLMVTATVSMPALKGQWKIPLLAGELRMFGVEIDRLRGGASGNASLHLIPGILSFIIYTDKGQLHFAASLKSGPLFAVNVIATGVLDPSSLSATIAALLAADPEKLTNERVRYLRENAMRLRTPQVLKEPQAPDLAPERVVLTVGDEQITAAELNNFFESIPFGRRNQRREFFAAKMIGTKVAAQEARRRSLHEKPSFRAKMRVYEDELLESEMRTDNGLLAPPDEAACRAYYDSHQAEFEAVKIRQIVVRTPWSALPVRIGQIALDDAQAFAKALDIRQRWLNGADFETLQKEESDQAPIFVPGHPFEWRERGADSSVFQNAITAAAFALEVGEISQPVKNEQGYHLIQVEGRRTKEFAEVQSKIEGQLRIRQQQEREEEMQIGAKVSLDAEYFSQLYKDEQPAEAIGAVVIGKGIPAEAIKPASHQVVRLDNHQLLVRLIRATRPVYPAEAREQNISGRVTLHVRIGADGRLIEAEGAEGHPLLVDAAIAAVREWLWRPMIEQGFPAEVISGISLEFNPARPR